MQLNNPELSLLAPDLDHDIILCSIFLGSRSTCPLFNDCTSVLKTDSANKYTTQTLHSKNLSWIHQRLLYLFSFLGRENRQ